MIPMGKASERLRGIDSICALIADCDLRPDF